MSQKLWKDFFLHQSFRHEQVNLTIKRHSNMSGEEKIEYENHEQEENFLAVEDESRSKEQAMFSLRSNGL